MARKAAPKETYTRNALVTSVTDGDTVVLSVDMGCDLKLQMNCRMVGINAPEKNTAAGKVTKAWLQNELPVGAPVIVQTVKNNGNKEEKEKYGRYLAVIYKPDNNVSMNDQLVAQKLAVSWNGVGERPV